MTRRSTADGILDEVALGGRIRVDTLVRMMALIEQKTDYHCHIALEIKTAAMLKTVDNEADALETIRRLEGAPDKKPKGALPATQHELFNADPNCKHEIVDAPGGGVKCKNCPGWFCY